MRQLRNGYFACVVGLIVLQFLGYGGLWLLPPFTFIAIFIALYLLVSQIKCPSCGVPLLGKKARKNPDTCYNCGRPLNGPKPTKRDVANELIDRFADERAAKVDWTPLPTASANFDNYKLHIDRQGRLSFKPTISSLMFAGVFSTMGILFYSVSWFIAPQIGLLFSLLPLFFIAMGLYLLYEDLKPIRVNRNAGLFVLGWKKDETVPLIEIMGLQLLQSKVHGKHHAYANYQLNLVKHNKERKNIVYYCHRQNAVRDAEQLAETLDIRLWNGINDK